MTANNLVTLSLGSNIDKEYHLLSAAKLLTDQCTFIKSSLLYETRSLHRDANSHDNYLNWVCIVHTKNSYKQLAQFIKRVETQLHRKRTENPDADRTIDIDMLLFNDDIIYDETQKCIIPHSDIGHKYFVDVPLAEIAPHVIHPIAQKPLKQICKTRQHPLDIWPRLDLSQRFHPYIK